MRSKNISYNEFHISKAVRNLCGVKDSLFSSYGNVIIRDIKSIQLFTLKLNEVFEKQGKPEKKVSSGSVNAMGLIDEVSHIVCALYRKKKNADVFSTLLGELNVKFGKEKIDQMLLLFTEIFPPTEVYKGKISAQAFLEKSAVDSLTGKTRSNREATLEELILLRLANENPAFRPFKILFDDSPLEVSSIYKDSWTEIQRFFESQPVFGPFGNTLIAMLREPMVFSPNDLSGQLEYIRKNWIHFFPELAEFSSLFFSSIDLLSEENKALWHPVNGGGQLPDLQTYSYENLMNEYENFTPDKDWMPKVVLMAKTVLVWLYQLSQKYKRNISTLDQIPDEELDILAQEGFTGLWLIGIWERSYASRRIKNICGNPEAAASAYSLSEYEIARNIGGWPAVENLRARLWQRGIRLASDMVPNHTAMDSRWIVERPNLFIQRRDNPFPQYTFNGENLSQDSRVSVYLEDHYYSKSDCAVVFKRVDNQTGDVRYIYHGNDGTGMPWNDTAQIDFLNPAAREAVIQEILHVARNFPIIRFDAAMVLAKKHIRRLWYPEPGHGGDIATRSQTQLSTKQFEDALPNEFWREVVDRVAKEVPDTLLLAEAFWMLEGYFVRTLGMHRVYNSAFMNMLKKEENQKYRDSIKNTLNFDPQVLKRFVNFMNNPDEESAVAQFGKGDKYFGICTLMVTMPGLPMFGHGQIEGFEEKYGMEYTRSYKNEIPDQELLERHKRQIFPLMKKRYLFAEIDNFLLYDVWDKGHVIESVFAYSNCVGNEKAIVLYNNCYEHAYGTIHTSATFAVKTGSGDEVELQTRTIGQGIGANNFEHRFILFRNMINGLWYIRRSTDICRYGLFVSLAGYETQIFTDIHEVIDDSEHKWEQLHDNLAGKGVQNLEDAWLELEYKDLYKALKHFLYPEFLKKVFAKLHPQIEEIGEGEKAKKTKPFTSKEFEELLAGIKIQGLEFYRQCALFAESEKAENHSAKQAEVKAGTSAKKLTAADKAKLADSFAKKEFKLFGENLKALFKLAASAKNKFAAKSEYFDAYFALTVLGSSAFTGNAAKWKLYRKFAHRFKEADISPDFVRANLESFVTLAPVCKMKNIKTAAEFIFKGENAPFLCGVNLYDNILWFNKERTEYTMNNIQVLKYFEGLYKPGTKKDVQAQAKGTSKDADFEKLVKAIKTAEYKVENVFKSLSPAKISSAKKKNLAKAKPERNTKSAIKAKTGGKTKTAKKTKTTGSAKSATTAKKAKAKKIREPSE